MFERDPTVIIICVKYECSLLFQDPSTTPEPFYLHQKPPQVTGESSNYGSFLVTDNSSSSGGSGGSGHIVYDSDRSKKDKDSSFYLHLQSDRRRPDDKLRTLFNEARLRDLEVSSDEDSDDVEGKVRVEVGRYGGVIHTYSARKAKFK